MAADGSGEETDSRSRWWGFPRPVRELPADLTVTVALVVLADLTVLLPVVSESPLRVLFGLPFLLFLPGYALVSALFPHRGLERDSEGTLDRIRSGDVDGVERVALAFGLSIAIVPAVGLLLHFTPWGIRPIPIVAALSALIIGLSLVAANRRGKLDPEDRFAVSFRDWYVAAREDLRSPATRTDAALNAVLIVVLVIGVVWTGYALGVPKATQQFTEFYVLTENDAGELVAEDYPTELTAGEPTPLVLAIENHEFERVQYVAVVRLQRVRLVDNETVVERSAELDRLRVALAHGNTWRQRYQVTPPFDGDGLRLQFLLYRGTAPAEPSIDTAYHELHLWVNVSTDG